MRSWFTRGPSDGGKGRLTVRMAESGLCSADEDAPVPAAIEVRDAKLRLVQKGRLDETFELAPGTYAVSATYPDGTKAHETAEVLQGKGAELALPYVLVERAPSWSNKVCFLGRDARERAPEFVGVRCLRVGSPAYRPGDGQGWDVRDAWGAVHVEPTAWDTDGQLLFASFTIELASGEAGPLFVQVATPGQVPVLAGLPMAPMSQATSCTVRVAVTADRTDIGVELPPGNGQTVARYMESGQLPLARQFMQNAEEILRRKVSNPIEAALGGYALLRLGDLERLHDWPANLADWFDWLADGAVIAGELDLRRGMVSSAAGYLVEAVRRGPPLFTDGLSILSGRLQELLRHRVPEVKQFDPVVRDGLLALSASADYSALMTTAQPSGESLRGMGLSPSLPPRPADGWRRLPDLALEPSGTDSLW